MKPQKLILCGWGPYKDETVIDFSKLNTELFLITGQTGAGKTTLFDAIAYALYGMLSGEVREKGTVRSDFADENTKTFVELFMTHKGLPYHIVRNPEYMRPKKKKGGESVFTKEKENAALTLPDGSMIAGNQDVTAKVEEILGMDGKQFRQISMIAQGEFARMLLASPAEKTTIFRELFGTGIYAAIQNGLKERSSHLYRDYMNYKHKMEEDIALISLKEEEWEKMVSHEQPDFEMVEGYLTAYLEELKKEIRNKKNEESVLQEKLLKLKEELTRAKELNNRFDEWDASKERLKELRDMQEHFERQKSFIAVLQAAKLLSLEEKNVLQVQQIAASEKARMELLQKEYTECLEEMKTHEPLYLCKEDIRAYYALQAQITENAESIDLASDKVEKSRSNLEKSQEEYLHANSIFEEEKKQYEEADRLYKNAVIGIAARYVEEGKPCPVCGSVEHPHVAETAKEIPDEKELEQLKVRMEEAGANSARLYEKALGYRNEEKVFQKTLEEFRDLQESLLKKEQGFAQEIRDYTASATQEFFEKIVLSYVENQSKSQEISKQAELSAIEYEKKSKESRMAQSAFAKKITAAGFTDEKQYADMVGQISRLDILEQEMAAYRENLHAAEEICAHLQTSLRGKERSNQVEIEQNFTDKQEELNSVRRNLQEEVTKEQQIERSLAGICKNRKESEKIRAEYGIVKDLDELANGNNARRLVFEQYVLAGYFEQILKAANLRLFDMTDGRYELIRSKQVGDGRRKDNLEILVMDYYTGKERSVKTLSGGETFKASLALALGMSDCIQARNGGTQVETLFIDEGFGALDEESLEQSCMVLQSLAGSDRMIGIISHVPELRERIESQIIIEKKNYGSSVRIRS